MTSCAQDRCSATLPGRAAEWVVAQVHDILVTCTKRAESTETDPQHKYSIIVLQAGLLFTKLHRRTAAHALWCDTEGAGWEDPAHSVTNE